MRKKLTILALIITVISSLVYLWHVHVNYRFKAVTENKVYKSALIAPDKLEKYLVSKNIKTVIDLIEKGKQHYVDSEVKAIEEINKKNNLHINHVHLISKQVPSKANLLEFYKILDNKINYPVLIHCYHGLGRTELYVALYKVEYENMTPLDARDDTRFIVQSPIYKSSFADTKPKGKFMINYKPRYMGVNSTLNTMKEE